MARQIAAIQYIRAGSAVAIVIFHAGIHYGLILPIGVGRIAAFFIMSGFVFGLITDGRPGRPGQFLSRRVARLAPLYWLVTLIVYAHEAAGLSPHPTASLRHLIASLLFIPDDNVAGQVFPVLVPGWTLTYEMFFCLTYTAILCLNPRRRIWAATALYGGLALAGIVFRPTDAILFAYTNKIVLEFLAGLWLAWLWPRVSLPRPVALGILLIGLAFSAAFSPASEAGYTALAAAVPALMIVAGALGLEKPDGAPIAWLTRVGDASYSIYLWHIPVLGACAAGLHALHITALPILIAGGTAASVIAGLVLYPLIERPMTNYLFARLDRMWTARAALAAA